MAEDPPAADASSPAAAVPAPQEVQHGARDPSHGPLCAKKPAAVDSIDGSCTREPSDRGPSGGHYANGWYPGKHLKEARERVKAREKEVAEARTRGEVWQPPRRPLLMLRNMALKQKRQLASRPDEDGTCVGHCLVSVLGGRFRTPRAYVRQCLV